jgi:hypothetical protein
MPGVPGALTVGRWFWLALVLSVSQRRGWGGEVLAAKNDYLVAG